MHSRVYKEFERIVAQRAVFGPVLEVGAVPSDDSLLCMTPLRSYHEKVGINLDGPYEYRDFKVLKGNGNCMECFEDDRFSMVLCNALLEHDMYFWKTMAEIKRVTKPGGLVAVGAPGYKCFGVEKLRSFLKTRIPGARRVLSNEYLEPFFSSTITFEVHNCPGDYYRFSEQAFREVILEGMIGVEVRCIMSPPRVIGVGTKPH